MHRAMRAAGSITAVALLTVGGAVSAQASAPATTHAAVAPAARAKKPATKGVVLRFTDSKGKVARGWFVKDVNRKLSCYGPSPAGVTPDTHMCGATADQAIACVPEADRKHVLCLRDPFTRLLLRYPLTGKLGVPGRPALTMPLGAQLADGSQWYLRIGGAWAPGPQDTLPIYGCHKGCRGTEALLTGPKGAKPYVIKDGATWYMRRGTMGSKLPKNARFSVQRLSTVWYIAR